MKRTIPLAFLAAAAFLPARADAQVAPAATPPATPPDSAYCVVDADGHLSIGGERVRFWGAIGSFPGRQTTIGDDPYAAQRAQVRRARRMGFNMFRVWHLSHDDTYAKGDLSATDISDFFVAECGRQGVRLWAAGFGGGRLFADEIEAAAGIIDDPGTADEWRQAVASMCAKHWWSGERKALSLLTPAVAWDPRLERLAIAQMHAKAGHLNRHTGLRHADDPTFAIWELGNEQWWMRHMVGGQWKNLPPFFRRSLLARWHGFLRNKYADDAGLARAWGFLLPGETLTKETILLAPLASPARAIELNDTNPDALAAFQAVETRYGRDDFTTRRGEDVLEFLLDLVVAHKRRFAAEVKSWGRSCRLSPLIFDTGIGESIQAQYLHQQADAVAHCSYMEGLQLEKIDPQHKRWPFYSGLDRPPQMANDVPWLEHNRAPGKPFLCYETQFGSPSKYRAEWPSRLAALAAVQDWDAVCFHYWTFDRYDLTKERPYSGQPLSWPGPGAFQYDYTSDEIEFSQMRAAGALFRHGLIAPAPAPTTFTFGRPALHDPRSMDYAGSYGRPGLDMLPTTYRHGLRLIIDPAQAEYVKIEGPVIRFNGYEQPCPIRPNDQIEFDYQRGHIVFDAPGAAGYTGFFGQYGADALRFRNGVSLSRIEHRDPEGCPYPSRSDERFVCFTLAGEDGRPLSTCAKAVLSLVASSFNTGLRVDPATRRVEYGTAPVLVTRVGATVAAPQLAGMRWRMIDFDEKILAEGRCAADGALTVPADLPVFLVELERP